MAQYQIVTRLDSEKWREFVYNHPHGNIFQTPEMFRVFQQTKNYEPVVVAAVDDQGTVAGILSAVIQKEPPRILAPLTARAVTWGGPIVKENNSRILEQLLEEYNRLIKHRVIYSQFRNFREQNAQKTVFQKMNYGYEEHLNFLVDLTKTEDQLWKQLSTKRRNKIRGAKKAKTTVKELTGETDIMESYLIIKDVYRRAGIPLADRSLFINAVEVLVPQKMIRFFGAVNNGKVIGTLIALSFKETLYDWYAGSYRDHYKKYPNDILPWGIFLWGKENGYRVFDFGGAGKPGVPYGVRDYKKQYGGQSVNFGRYQNDHKPKLMKIAKTGFRLWQRLKK
ncbi:MAG: GNAT family N-acetyltransferase [bacterium]|nr:GNAT family N-acetyltransferase [bacterium]